GLVAEQKAPKGHRPPAVPFNRARGRKEACSGEPIAQVGPTVRRKREVKIVCVTLEPVEADGVSPQDEARDTYRFEGSDDGGEPFLGVHSTASSHPRLPCARSICISGWRPSSSSESPLCSSRTTSGRHESRYSSSASRTISALPRSRNSATGSL